MRTIYIDVLIITNFITSLFLLLLVKKITHSGCKNYKMVLSAFALSLTALLIVFDKNTIISSLLITAIKVIAAVVSLAFCFNCKNKRAIAKYFLVYILVNTVFVGVCTLVWNFSGGRVIYVNNGAVYFDVSLTELVIFTIIAYLLISFYEFVKNRLFDKNIAYKISFEYSGRDFCLNAISDTGNRLVDVFYQKPVIVCFSDRIWSQLNLDNEENIVKLKLHPLAMQTLGGKKIIYAAKPQDVSVRLGDKSKTCLACIGFLPSEKMTERCVFNPNILF